MGPYQHQPFAKWNLDRRTCGLCLPAEARNDNGGGNETGQPARHDYLDAGGVNRNRLSSIARFACGS